MLCAVIVGVVVVDDVVAGVVINALVMVDAVMAGAVSNGVVMVGAVMDAAVENVAVIFGVVVPGAVIVGAFWNTLKSRIMRSVCAALSINHWFLSLDLQMN